MIFLHGSVSVTIKTPISKYSSTLSVSIVYIYICHHWRPRQPLIVFPQPSQTDPWMPSMAPGRLYCRARKGVLDATHKSLTVLGSSLASCPRSVVASYVLCQKSKGHGYEHHFVALSLLGMLLLMMMMMMLLLLMMMMMTTTSCTLRTVKQELTKRPAVTLPSAYSLLQKSSRRHDSMQVSFGSSSVKVPT